MAPTSGTQVTQPGCSVTAHSLQMGNHATMPSIFCFDLKVPQIGFFKLHESLFCDEDFGFLWGNPSWGEKGANKNPPLQFLRET